MAKPRWDVLAFGHCPLQEGKDRTEGWCGEESGVSTAGKRHRMGPLAQQEPQFRRKGGVRGVRRASPWGHLCVPCASSSIWSLCREGSACDKPVFRKQSHVACLSHIVTVKCLVLQTEQMLTCLFVAMECNLRTFTVILNFIFLSWNTSIPIQLCNHSIISENMFFSVWQKMRQMSSSHINKLFLTTPFTVLIVL